MEPRKIIRSTECVLEFVQYSRDNIPDVSERPEMRDEQVQFWMMTDDGDVPVRPRKSKKRFPATHSRLPGLMAKRLNKSIDLTMAHNMWCVTFRDKDGKLVSLVYDCIATCWLYYIADLVRARTCGCNPNPNPNLTLTLTERTSARFQQRVSVDTEIHAHESTRFREGFSQPGIRFL
jgi:hypothetical protein